MAVDSRQKRMSMLNFSGQDVTLFEADSSIDLDDRQHLLDCYSGIAFETPSTPNRPEWWFTKFVLGH